MGGDTDGALRRIDGEARAEQPGAEAAVVAKIAKSQAERAVCTQCVVAQDAAVRLAVVVVAAPGGGIDKAAVAGTGVVGVGVEAGGVGGVVGDPACGVVKRRGGIVA